LRDAGGLEVYTHVPAGAADGLGLADGLRLRLGDGDEAAAVLAFAPLRL
jgi:hypothetical protein